MSDKIEDIDRALMSAMRPKSLNGTTLKPYSYVRQQTAVQMGIRFRFNSRMNDAAINVWLCTLDDDDVLAICESDESIKAARKAAFAWADSKGYSLMDCEELMDLHNKMTNELFSLANARIKPKEGEEATPAEPDPNAGGPQL